ncbi:Trihelix transcription factor GT-2 [Raphanus sativus]|uniref:Trihelix transcription factor GT-2 n=1 Tax=Raphanus sativus TaxID=3726 RepID=A0A6J0KGA9_RAPSA|nr:trihelix transcription factor GT-2 [Raphanus sativus]KAJ4883959.1 Trihelix transcription factor GT-2 [Raphanus sativus]
MSGNSLGLLDSSGGGVGGSAEEEKDMKMEETNEVGGGGGGSRWPRPETLALLRIRSEMDKSFRDSTLKAPLWEEISRKMMELGYKRSAKKCKEKFENVYKYHKRTKEGRTGKSEGKTYRFFEELEAFESQPAKSPAATTTTIATTPLIPWISSTTPSTEKTSSPLKHQQHHQVSVKPIATSPTFLTKQPSSTTPFPFYSNNHTTTLDTGHKPTSNDLVNNVSSLNLFSSSTSSSTASDEEDDQEKRSRKKRKYWKGLFTKLTKELMEKQEKMQKRFLESLENREKERISREEAWRVQEVARISREYETLVNERSNAAAKDAAIISFLHKISGGQQQQQPQQQPQQNHKVPQRKQYQSEQHSITFESKEPRPVLLETTMKMGNHSLSPSSSRWPKTEVEALIRIRKNLEANYQENGTKGPLWEEISAGMRRLGYNRSAKRCKEKWENINKYFKKVKESNKKRPLDSKTCPYFHQLEALYNERNKSGALPMLPLMVTPQRQLLLPQETQTEFETDHRDRAGNKEGEEEGESEEDDYEDEEEEGEGDNETSEFEIVLNKTSSPMDINNNLFT